MQQPMPKSLELRPLPYIAAGYVLGPIGGLTALWLLWIASMVAGRLHPWDHALMMWLYMIVVGGAICLAVELVAVTPLLIGFSRYRWRWINGWTAVVIGFLAGAAIGSPPLYWAFTMLGAQFSAGTAFVFPLMLGMVGAVAALVFRLIAVRAVSNSNLV
jgi:hypothetical protein